MQGNLFIIAAPSGAGKTSLVNQLVQQVDTLKISISHTTRTPRAGEQNGGCHSVSLYGKRSATTFDRRLRQIEGGLATARHNTKQRVSGRRCICVDR